MSLAPWSEGCLLSLSAERHEEVRPEERTKQRHANIKLQLKTHLNSEILNVHVPCLSHVKLLVLRLLLDKTFTFNQCTHARTVTITTTSIIRADGNYAEIQSALQRLDKQIIWPAV